MGNLVRFYNLCQRVDRQLNHTQLITCHGRWRSTKGKDTADWTQLIVLKCQMPKSNTMLCWSFNSNSSDTIKQPACEEWKEHSGSPSDSLTKIGVVPGRLECLKLTPSWSRFGVTKPEEREATYSSPGWKLIHHQREVSVLRGAFRWRC